MRARGIAAFVIGAALCGSCGSTAPAGSSPSGLSGAITVFAASSLRSAYPAIGDLRAITLGGRYTRNAIRFDVGFSFGLTTIDPTIGFSGGFTYVFNAFTIP